MELDEGRTNGGESRRDRGEGYPSLSGPGRTVPRPKVAAMERREASVPIARDAAPQGVQWLRLSALHPSDFPGEFGPAGAGRETAAGCRK